MRKLFQAACAGLLLSAMSCQSDQEESNLVPTPETETEDFVQEEAYPGVVGEFESLALNGEEVSGMRVDDEYVLEGDMLVPQEVVNTTNGNTEAVGVIGRRWSNGIIYYQIASNMPDVNRTRIRDAIRHWEERTPVRFVRRTNQRNYVVFQPGSGCSANVGMIGGRQVINLSTRCSTGNTIHEIGHCAGLYHEHTRLNRDRYLYIAFNNIQEGRENNFVRADLRTSDVRDWSGNSVDYGSIMMYSSTAFSKNGNRTIIRRDGRSYTAQRNGLSSLDITGIDRMY